MTKKNLAALMLAGAMMTVGSGAMAGEKVYDTTGNNNTITIPVTASTENTVNITVKWGWGAGQTETAPNFEFEWDGTNYTWKVKGDTSSYDVKFSALNKGSQIKQVGISNATVNKPNWLTIGTDLDGVDIPKATTLTKDTYTDIGTISVGADASKIQDSALPSGEQTLSFNIVVAN